MMKNTIQVLIVLILCILSMMTKAQQGIGDYQSGFRHDGNTIYFSNENADVRIAFCTSAMFRVSTSFDRAFEENEPWMVVKYTWEPVDIQITEEANDFLIRTDSLQVRVHKSPFTLTVTDLNGKVLSAEDPAQNGGSFQEESAVFCRKDLMSNEHFFGFGERMDFMDQRGKKVQLNVGRGTAQPHIMGAYNILEANYCPVPFFMSTRGYGIFFHNSYATEWDMGHSDPESYTFKAADGELDYYFIYGPRFLSLIDQYTILTGKSPLLPRFAFGLHVGTYSGGTWGHEELTSTQYVIELARKFRELGIPLDVLHLDSTWRIFGKNGGKGATTFEWRDTFKNPEGMFDSLYALGLNMVGVHVRPRFDNGNQLNLLAMARKEGFVYPEEDAPGEFVNFFDPEAVDWWWENGVMQVASMGAKFLKTDEGSAFGHVANESDKTGPTDDEARRLHNLFPIAYAKAPYEKFQAYNGIRGMNHTREGYAGIQRYPFIFAGDWPSEWQYFAPVIKAGLNIGLSGVGYWAHCMGGFEHNADPELYIRWCQFGLLSPVAHLFGMDHPGYKEPWNYGEEAQKIFKQYDRMRYRLIPYLYSHAYEMYQTGKPLMRALVLEYQEDPNVYDIADQYLLGSSMMVCPVTTKSAQTRVVYLPEGTWFDYWTGEQHAGKQYINVQTPLDQIPIFVKGGGIIPMQEAMNYIGEKPVDRLELDIFPYEKSNFALYDDDGKSLDYQQGKFATTAITCNQTDTQISINILSPKGNYEVTQRSYQLRVHASSIPQSVVSMEKDLEKFRNYEAYTNAGEQAGWFYDQENQVIMIRPVGTSQQDISVEIL